MDPIDSVTENYSDWPVAPLDACLDELVDISVNTAFPIVIKSGEQTLGVVTQKNLLRGVQGRFDSAMDEDVHNGG
jgi:glycine betaine/proline transport system ATP-binding protein